MPRLSKEQRHQAIGMAYAGMSNTKISRYFGCSQSTVSRLLARLQITGSVDDRKRPGYPKAVSRRTKRAILRGHITDPYLPAANTAKRFQIHPNTVAKILKKAHFKRRRPISGPILTQNHKNIRRIWALSCQNWTQTDWSKVLFTDECRFSLNSDDKRVHVWSRARTRKSGEFSQKYDRWGSKSLMIWGGVSADNRTRPILIMGSVDATKYKSDVLEAEVVPFLAENPDVMAFQHDNAPAHRAASTAQFLASSGIPTLPWPALSPDMNPIEHVWDHMKRKIRAQNPQNLKELAREIIDSWTKMPQSYVKKLIFSMPRRIQALIRARGGTTPY